VVQAPVPVRDGTAEPAVGEQVEEDLEESVVA
jgi:hypothetical protein